MDVTAAVEGFLLSMESELSPKTVKWYRRTLPKFTNHFGPVEVQAITADDLRRWRSVLFNQPTARGGPPAQNTKRDWIRAVKRLFNWLVEEGVIERSPAARLRLPRMEEKAPSMIEPADFAALLWHMKAHRRQFYWRDIAVLLFLLGTGARVGGLISATIEALELDNGRAWILKKGRQRGYWVFLDPPLVEALRCYLALERPPHPTGPVFYGQRGPLTEQGVWWMLKHHARRAGVVGRVNPHSFRHAFSILRLQAGDNLSSVSELLGHASIKTTHEYYAKWGADRLKQQHAKYSPLGDLPAEVIAGKIEAPRTVE